jgi:hypothetical protein
MYINRTLAGGHLLALLSVASSSRNFCRATHVSWLSAQKTLKRVYMINLTSHWLSEQTHIHPKVKVFVGSTYILLGLLPGPQEISSDVHSHHLSIVCFHCRQCYGRACFAFGILALSTTSAYQIWKVTMK